MTKVHPQYRTKSLIFETIFLVVSRRRSTCRDSLITGTNESCTMMAHNMATAPTNATLPHLLQQRCCGQASSTCFTNRVLRKRSRRSLLTSHRLIPGVVRTPASCLDLSKEGRFLLAGRRNGSIVLFDLSNWGGQREADGISYQYAPVAEALRTPRPIRSREQQVRIPTGHTAEVSAARWYPEDTGAFISASTDGTLLVWDTREMTPVLQCTPFSRPSPDTYPPQEYVGITSMDLSQRSNHSVAVASRSDRNIKLVDIRTGASSHSLVGHEKGVACLQWSPSSEYVFASGGNRAVRLWDIRKSGSRSCLCVLNQNFTPDLTMSKSSKPHYAHLRPSLSDRHWPPKSKKQKVSRASAPNDYSQVQSNSIASTDRSVLNLAFDPTDRYLVTHDGSLAVWDLRDGQGAYRIPRRFTTATGSADLLPENSLMQMPMPPRPPGKPPLCVTDDGGDLNIWTSFESNILSFPIGPPNARYGEHDLQGHMAPIQCIATSVDTDLMVSAGRDGLILLWSHQPRASGQSGKNPERRDTDNW